MSWQEIDRYKPKINLVECSIKNREWREIKWNLLMLKH